MTINSSVLVIVTVISLNAPVISFYDSDCLTAGVMSLASIDKSWLTRLRAGVYFAPDIPSDLFEVMLAT